MCFVDNNKTTKLGQSDELNVAYYPKRLFFVDF